MTRFATWTDYLYPGGRVLRNKRNIRDASELRHFEEEVARLRASEILIQNPIDGRLDRAHMQAIHRHIFGDIYEWAGEVRVGPVQPRTMVKVGPSPQSIVAGNFGADDGHD